MINTLNFDLVTFLVGTLAEAFVTGLVVGSWLGWMLYRKLEKSAFRKVLLVLLRVSGMALAVSGRLQA
jgi:F0F1-type ATP synthase assembly protein I